MPVCGSDVAMHASAEDALISNGKLREQAARSVKVHLVLNQGDELIKDAITCFTRLEYLIAHKHPQINMIVGSTIVVAFGHVHIITSQSIDKSSSHSRHADVAESVLRILVFY